MILPGSCTAFEMMAMFPERAACKEKNIRENKVTEVIVTNPRSMPFNRKGSGGI